jgi:hypothetical protein
VAVAVKTTARGAVPEEGDAEAVQESVQAGGGLTVTVPVLEQAASPSVEVMVHM